MHTGARLFKYHCTENKATCKVMNLIKLAHRHLKLQLLQLYLSVQQSVMQSEANQC